MGGRTQMKRAIDLAVGDVIVDPAGREHTVTAWEVFAEICVSYATDTGHRARVPWIAALSFDRGYAVRAKAGA
ncbi:hypothetical protein [Pseudonocardia zijingensis]|uniref:Uncharacterized protein n=1 Tax=Pseudonocardia zijingensis TaxID=153376 RepID=A0ABN1NL28_9PSEU